MRKLGLVGLFALRSLLLMVTLTAALGWMFTSRIEHTYIDGAARTARAIASAGITHELAASGLDGPIDPMTKERLDSIISGDLRSTGVFALKLWGPDGTLVYSSFPQDEIGASFAQENDVSGALAGKTEVEVVRSATAENVNQFDAEGALIEVYSPLRDPATGRVVGVFELYQSYAPVLAEIRMSNTLVWGFIVLGSAMALVIQIGMFKRMSDRLVVTEEQIDTMDERLRGSLQDLEEYSLGTLQALISAVDAKDSYTASHSLTVTDYAVAIGRRIGLSREELDELERASLLHDVGKIGIPEAVLLKPARLTDDEFALVRKHSASGAKIIESIPFLRPLVPVVRHHHERWDGAGYPDGLPGERIPRLARILAVADAFDAMTSDRPYRPGMRTTAARQELTRFRGTQFDPEAVDALLGALDAREIVVTLWRHRAGGIAQQVSA